MKRPGIQDMGLALCLLLLAVIAFRPSGVLGSRLQAWNAERQVLALYRAEWREAASSRRSTLGSDGDAPVIFEFSDYQCPFCRSSHEAVAGWATSAAARIVLVHVPLSDRSREAARAAVCAEEAGAFPRMHDYLMTNDEWVTEEAAWESTADAADVPAGTWFARCLESTATAERITRDSALAVRWRVTATPTFVSAHAWTIGEVSDGDLETLLGR
ncbi:DsbA family protein [Candidatus Palauibacter sp.]|uniref:DsbA family protein n=1 Tax=Candidatus Palauibacter sp. TaxID=3101350 RepID=UPI003B5C45F1